jgi:hypothetical protein
LSGKDKKKQAIGIAFYNFYIKEVSALAKAVGSENITVSFMSQN